MTRPRRTAALVVCGLLLAACGTAPRAQTQPLIRAVRLGQDGRTVTTTVVVGGCQTGRLTGRESDTAITLRLSIRTREKAGQVCSAGIRLAPVGLTLRSPLGNRKVVDAATGRTLGIGSGPGSPFRSPSPPPTAVAPSAFLTPASPPTAGHVVGRAVFRPPVRITEASKIDIIRQ